MSVPATEFLTYLWHYVVARLLYDDLVHPLIRGLGVVVGSLVGVASAVMVGIAVAVVLGRRRRRRS